jgi:hypothetical protein
LSAARAGSFKKYSDLVAVAALIKRIDGRASNSVNRNVYDGGSESTALVL